VGSIAGAGKFSAKFSGEFPAKFSGDLSENFSGIHVDALDRICSQGVWGLVFRTAGFEKE
jgi:hypothetical protein